MANIRTLAAVSHLCLGENIIDYLYERLLVRDIPLSGSIPRRTTFPYKKLLRYASTVLYRRTNRFTKPRERRWNAECSAPFPRTLLRGGEAHPGKPHTSHATLFILPPPTIALCVCAVHPTPNLKPSWSRHEDPRGECEAEGDAGLELAKGHKSMQPPPDQYNCESKLELINNRSYCLLLPSFTPSLVPFSPSLVRLTPFPFHPITLSILVLCTGESRPRIALLSHDLFPVWQMPTLLPLDTSS